MINAAIIGLGWWGKTIVDAVQGKSKKIRFVHGVSHEPDAVRDYAKDKGFTLSTTLEAALTDSQVQVVWLATPHSTHRKLVEQVAAAGKPVFCEKPFALKFNDALAMVDACKKAGVPVGVGQNKRFWPSMVALREVVASGVLGRVLHIEGHYSNENSSNFFAPWRDLPSETPGAGMTGTGIHILDAFTTIRSTPSRYYSSSPTVSAVFSARCDLRRFTGAYRCSATKVRLKPSAKPKSSPV
jgi:predicted dehydrogenase